MPNIVGIRFWTNCTIGSRYICSDINSELYFKPPRQLNWFLSHRQISGQGIALGLFQELSKRNETVFLDIRSEFDLHDLEKCVELSDYFVLVLSEGIFNSPYCLKGITMMW
jgi:hypothetical protein